MQLWWNKPRLKCNYDETSWTLFCYFLDPGFLNWGHTLFGVWKVRNKVQVRKQHIIQKQDNGKLIVYLLFFCVLWGFTAEARVPVTNAKGVCAKKFKSLAFNLWAWLLLLNVLLWLRLKLDMLAWTLSSFLTALSQCLARSAFDWKLFHVFITSLLWENNR